jgi:glutamate-ammonia-ligase adenylyltransferase
MTAGAAADVARDTDWLLRPAAKLAPLESSRAAEEVKDIATAAADEGHSRLARLLTKKGPLQDFLAAVFDLSPFLRDLARRRPEMLDALLDAGVEQQLDAILAGIGRLAAAEEASESRLMMELRRLKTEAHFTIALADLAGEADTAATVRRLSRLAGACVRAAVDFLLLDAHRQGKLKLPDPAPARAGIRLDPARHGQARRP